MNRTPSADSEKIALVPKFKNWRIVAASVAVVLAVFIALISYQPKQTDGLRCGNYRKDRTISIGSAKLQAEVAQTQAEQIKGLGGRPCIEANQAMLFIFSKPSHYGIWMKDMRFPIDIVWISPENKVVGLEKNVLPSTYPNSFVNRDNLAQYVLELQSNRSNSLDIKLGTSLNF